MGYIKVEIHGKLKNKINIEGLLANHDVFQLEEISHDVIDELGNKELSWDYVDPKILNVDKDSLILRFFLEEDQVKLIKKIKDEVEFSCFGEVVYEEIKEEDWANNWKEFFHPIHVDNKITIVPTWEEYEAQEEENVILMDPGMAFGSGTHETTFMCMSLLSKYVKKGDTVFDIGCGSGILSLVAAAKGAEKVIGVDLDPVCISASKQNIELNNMGDRVDIYEGDLFEVVEGKANVIVSNLFAEVIVGMLDDLCSHLKEKGTFIASGILNDKVSMVEEALLKKGFTIMNTESKGEWACILAKAK